MKKTVKTFIFTKLFGLFLLWGLGFLILELPLQGCNQTPSLEQKSEGFLKAYYQEANLQKALSLSTGLAARKIKSQIRLGGGQASPEQRFNRKITFSKDFKLSDPKKSASYHSPDRREIFYNLKIKVEKNEIKRLVRLTLISSTENNQNQWKISNFVETKS